MTLGIIVGCTAWALAVGRGPLEAGIDALARLTVRGRVEAPGTAMPPR
ncbi:MAG: acyltransferase [Microbacterium sp.]|nr:acyltransferase [Microbacterium sp.]